MRGVLITAIVLLLGGCVLWGGGPREVPLNPELEHSRKLISQTAKNPMVVGNFKRELDSARNALNKATLIWNEEQGKLDDDDDEWHEIRHLNYLARQRTAIVVMKARGLDAQRELSELQTGRSAVSTGHRPEPSPVERRVVSTKLPPALQALQPRQETRGLVLTLNDHNFGVEQQLVNSDALFDALLAYLVANPRKIVSCEGYADGVDGPSQGQRLSQQRARVVQDALLERGLEFSRVTAVGYGSARPNNAYYASSHNRVEIVISDTVPVTFDDDRP